MNSRGQRWKSQWLSARLPFRPQNFGLLSVNLPSLISLLPHHAIPATGPKGHDTTQSRSIQENYQSICCPNSICQSHGVSKTDSQVGGWNERLNAHTTTLTNRCLCPKSDLFNQPKLRNVVDDGDSKETRLVLLRSDVTSPGNSHFDLTTATIIWFKHWHAISRFLKNWKRCPMKEKS